MEKKEAVTRFDFVEADKRIIDQRFRKHEISPQEYLKILKMASDDKEAADELIVCRETEHSS